MLISINRIYKSTGLSAEILINTRYIVRIEETKDPRAPTTRIVFDGIDRKGGPSVIYTDATINSIKAKLTKARKNAVADEE